MPKNEVELTQGYETVKRRLEALPGEVMTQMYLALRDIGVGHRVKMVEERLSSPSTDNPWLATRSGDLKRKMQDTPFQLGPEDDNLVLRIQLDHPFSTIHEHGTVGAGGTLPDIVPVRASWLTIPLPAAQTPTGVSLGSAREVGAEYDQTWFARAKFGDGEALILYGAKGDSVFPLFRLVKRVAIKPRLGFFQTWHDMKEFRTKRLARAVKDAVKATKQAT